MIDFHTHVLPDFDDGPKDDEASRALVEELMAQGVDTIVSTSHFYPDEESPDDFVVRRDGSFCHLEDLCADLDGLTLIQGAEVYCNEMLEIMADFRGLTIGDTSVILVELPNVRTLSPRIMKILKRLSDRHGLTPVIAHVERYPELHRFAARKVKRLRDLGCLIQINCDSIVGGKYNKVVNLLLDKGLVDLIGSDSHGTDRRPPHFAQACEIIERDFGRDVLGRLLGNAERLIGRDGRTWTQTRTDGDGGDPLALL